MFEFTRARMDRAVSDFLGFYQHHVWGFVLPLVAAAIALPTVRYLAGADLTEEVWLLVAYGVIGPLALAVLIFAWFYWRAGAKIYVDQARRLAAGEARDEPFYWTICECVTWLAYGRAMKTTAYSLDGIDILRAEELPAVRLAEQALLTALQDPNRIVAYGRRDGRGEHAAVPFTYFLAAGVSTNIFNDSFGLGPDASIEDIQHRSSFPEWTEIKIPRSQILKIWPKGRLYSRPAGKDPEKAAEAIKDFMRAADALSTKPLSGPDEVRELEMSYRHWHSSVVEWLFENSTLDRARHFAQGSFMVVTRHSHEVDEAHRHLISRIKRDREISPNC